jgi:hypothetical protein
MADPTVVSIVEARLVPGLDPVTEPYITVLNTRPPGLPNVHVSIERDYSSVDRVTLGRPAQFRETGSITVVVNVRAGIGDYDASILSEKIRNLFHNYYLEHFRVTVVGSAAVFDPDDGNFFQTKIPVQYEFDFFK